MVRFLRWLRLRSKRPIDVPEEFEKYVNEAPLFRPAMRLRYGLCCIGLHKRYPTTYTKDGTVTPIYFCDRCWSMWRC